MARLSRLIREDARWWHVALALAYFVAGSILLIRFGPGAPFYARTANFTLENTYGYAPDAVSAFLASLGTDGRALMRTALTWDLVYPFIFAPSLAFALAVPLARLLPQARAWWVALILVGLSAPIDWLEDALLLTLLSRFPEESPRLAQLASVVTMAKLGILHSALALIPIALIAWATAAWAAGRRRTSAPGA